MKLLSLVFSFRNEEENLKELIERLNVVLSKLNDWKFNSYSNKNIWNDTDSQS